MLFAALNPNYDINIEPAGTRSKLFRPLRSESGRHSSSIGNPVQIITTDPP